MLVLKPGTEEVLFERTFGADDSDDWDHPYDKIALSKAQICQRTGISSRDVRNDAGWLIETGDTLYVGAVIENGLVVGASGLQDHFDEMVCRVIIATIQALVRHQIVGTPENAGDFYKDEAA